MFPNANIASTRIDSYPVTVTIEAEVDSDLEVVWKGSQKDLFSKNGHRAVPAIVANLEKLKAKV